MARTISTAVNGPVTLKRSDNPLSITGGGSVTSNGAGADGIDGAAGTNWSVSNSGRVSSAGGNGILLQGAATVANAGSISGAYGIDLRAGGTVTNTSGATLAGSVTGLRINRGAGHAHERRLHHRAGQVCRDPGPGRQRHQHRVHHRRGRTAYASRAPRATPRTPAWSRGPGTTGSRCSRAAS